MEVSKCEEDEEQIQVALEHLTKVLPEKLYIIELCNRGVRYFETNRWCWGPSHESVVLGACGQYLRHIRSTQGPGIFLHSYFVYIK